MNGGAVVGASNFRNQRDEALSLGAPVGNYALNVGVLNNSVRDPSGQDIFDQDAVGQDLSDVAVAGTGPRAPSGFQLDGNDTMTGVDQIVRAAGESISV